MLKILFKICVFIFLNVFGLMAQYPVEEECLTYYFGNTGFFYSGSGYQLGYNLNVGIQKGRKALFAGIIYHGNENFISGALINYRIYIGKFEEPISYIKPFQPYFQYNLIYHMATIYENVIITSNGKIIEVDDNESGRIATMEHYFTGGLKFKIIGNLYMTTSAGIGVYIGSLSKFHHPKTIGIHGINEGLTMYFNFGIEYSFARQKKSIEL